MAVTEVANGFILPEGWPELASEVEPICGHSHRKSGYICNIRRNHAGPHCAGVGGRRFVAFWQRERSN